MLPCSVAQMCKTAGTDVSATTAKVPIVISCVFQYGRAAVQDEVLIAGFGRRGHAVGDIPGVRFKVRRPTAMRVFACVESASLFTKAPQQQMDLYADG